MDNINTYDEKELLMQLSQGNEKALKVLYDMQYKKFLYFADCLIGDHSQAQDIVIISFSRYWERRTQFNDLKAIAAYMYVTIRNDCYKHHNLLKRRLLHEKQISGLSSEEENFAESRIVLAETLQYIHNQIEGLSPHYRDVIKLLFIDEVSIKDVALKLGISPENVRKRKERGIQYLKLKIIKDKITPLALLCLGFLK